MEGKKYRVTWKTFKDPVGGLPGHDDVSMVEHEREFRDVDQGYGFYQNLQKGRSRTYGATWEHVDPS